MLLRDADDLFAINGREPIYCYGEAMRHGRFTSVLSRRSIVGVALASLCGVFTGCEVRENTHYQVGTTGGRVRDVKLARTVTDQILAMWESADSDR